MTAINKKQAANLTDKLKNRAITKKKEKAASHVTKNEAGNKNNKKNGLTTV